MIDDGVAPTSEKIFVGVDTVLRQTFSVEQREPRRCEVSGDTSMSQHCLACFGSPDDYRLLYIMMTAGEPTVTV